MGQNNSKGAASYSKPLIQGLPDALPHFDIKVGKPADALSFVFSPLDWECLDKPLHISGQEVEMQQSPANEMKDWKPVYNTWISGVHTATFPKVINPETGRSEWMRHPLADAFLMEVTDTCAFGGLWDGNGGGLKGWAAAHIAMWHTKQTILKHIRQHKLKSSTEVAKLLESALMASHRSILKVDEAQSTTAVLWFVVALSKGQYGMVYAAVGDVELFLYSQANKDWMPLLHPFTDLRFKEVAHKHRIEGGIGNAFGTFTELKEGMNLQYGAVLLAEDDIIVAATDGLGDVLDPIPARIPPKQVGLGFSDWNHFAKQHAMDGPPMIQELKVKRFREAVGPVRNELQADDMKELMNKLTAFVMASTKGERELYADPANRNENGRVLQDTVDKKRTAGLAAGDYSYAKMDHCGMLAFSPKCLTVPKPAQSATHLVRPSSSSMLVSMSAGSGSFVTEKLHKLGDQMASLALMRKSQRPDKQ